MAKKVLSAICLIVGDALAFVLTIFLSDIVRFRVLPLIFNLSSNSSSYDEFLVFAPIWIAEFMANGLYTRRNTFQTELKHIFVSHLSACVMLFALSFFLRFFHLSRGVILIAGVIGLFIFPFERYIVKWIMFRLRIWRKKVVIITSEGVSDNFVNFIGKNFYIGYSEPLVVKFNPHIFMNEIKRTFDEVKNADLIVHMKGIPLEIVEDIIEEGASFAESIKIVPDLPYISLSTIEPQLFEGTFLLQVNINLAKPWNLWLKEVFDRFVAFLAVILLTPLFALIALAIYFDDGLPIFHLQERIGRKGKKFKFYKFRTMFKDADERLKEYLKANPEREAEWNRFMKLKGFDPRVTLTGRVLRKFSLDELPQLFNVLKGDMSLVGPRPYLERELERMGIHKDVIIKVKPGITGLWQVSGRNELSFEDRLKLDEFYVRNWSLWLDIYILIKTVWVVITGRGAY